MTWINQYKYVHGSFCSTSCPTPGCKQLHRCSQSHPRPQHQTCSAPAKTIAATKAKFRLSFPFILTSTPLPSLRLASQFLKKKHAKQLSPQKAFGHHSCSAAGLSGPCRPASLASPPVQGCSCSEVVGRVCECFAGWLTLAKWMNVEFLKKSSFWNPLNECIIMWI